MAKSDNDDFCLDESSSSDTESAKMSDPPKKRRRHHDNSSSGSSPSSSNEPDISSELIRRKMPKKRGYIEGGGFGRHHGHSSSDSPPSSLNEPDGSSLMSSQGIGSKLMKKMGYKEETGLGARGQGIKEPVQVTLRTNRRGFGAPETGLEPSFDVTWDVDSENVEVEEKAEWFPECPHDVLTELELEGWLRTGKMVSRIDDETEFCDPELISGLLRAKSVFDELEDHKLRNARSRANPFETIRNVFFQNRAAMKMANMDAVFDGLFTQPKDPKNPNIEWVPMESEQLFYFADVCAGPGGFSEYVLFRRGWSAHGFGMTLKGKDDFNLEKFKASMPEFFETHYGKYNDGDVTNPENLTSLRDFVLSVTKEGVHLMMADGGFSVEGEENLQEVLSKRLYLCQCLCAMNILRTGGTFVCKLFDVFTPFSVGLLYLLWRSFDHVCLHKPHTSRPANSERYIICKGKREGVQCVTDYLTKANLEYDRIQKDGLSKEDDIIELVPIQILKDEAAFDKYIINSNNKWATRQISYLEKYKAYAINSNLQESTRQQELRERCLEYWKIPDNQRNADQRASPHQVFSRLISDPYKVGELFRRIVPSKLKPECLKGPDINSYRICLRTGDPSIFLSLGSGRVYFMDHLLIHDTEKPIWKEVNVKLNIPRDTILFAELSTEYTEEKPNGQPILHVFDAFCLAGEIIDSCPYRDRKNKLNKFCQAIRRNDAKDFAIVKHAEMWQILDIVAMRNCFRFKITKEGGRPVFYYKEPTGMYRRAQGFIVYRILTDDITIEESSKNGNKPRLYFYNKKTNTGQFEGSREMYKTFVDMHITRFHLPASGPTRAYEPEEQLSRLLEWMKGLEGSTS